MAFPAYKLIISGDRYERVVYLRDTGSGERQVKGLSSPGYVLRHQEVLFPQYDIAAAAGRLH
ncbi:hypothetical protein EYF80_053006 [Liparis tanakae]|uniref:Uncharacterized protein n=1 Tax=Liparis tanakae TaxID=230148 RepID=A0A4Z2F6T1_9TELE|nr:hypothetical protein EYF80_053006 [Liparis tanakae]